MSQRTERAIVTASEIQALPQFEAYIRFAYDAPTAKVYFEPVSTEPRAEKLVPYHGAGFDMDGMDPHKSPAPSENERSMPAHFAPELLNEVDAERRSKFAAWPIDRQMLHLRNGAEKQPSRSSIPQLVILNLTLATAILT